MFPKQFINEISKYDKIICLISGGYHSSVSALELKEHKFDNVILLNNRTYLEEPFSLGIMKKIQELTEYPLVRAKPNLKQRPAEILRESFEQWRVEFASNEMKTSKNRYRDKLPCCRKLKKTPAKKWYSDNCNENDIIISSICAYEGGALGNRWMRLKELRDDNTFLRFHKTKDVWYAYPWRDYTKKSRESHFYTYLRRKGIMPEHSGCICCPIRVARMIKRNDFFDCPDLRLYCNINKLDIYEFIPKGKQQKITEFL